MQIHRIRGRDLRDALERARAMHGSAALVLGHEPLPGGGVTVAIAREPEERPSARTAETRRPQSSDPGRADVERRLRRSGCSEHWIAGALDELELSGARGTHAIDVAARSLGRRLRVAPSPKVRQRSLAGGEAQLCILAFVGPTGVGKTTTLAKLASRLVRSGRRVALATLDGHRPGAVEQLSSYAEVLQTPLDVAGDSRDLARAIERARSMDVLLVDTTGRSPRDLEALAPVAEDLRLAARALPRATLDTYLVVAATASRAALDEVASGFSPLHPAALVITKLDETREPAPALELAARADLPIAFLSDGQDVSAHLHRAHEGLFADLFLRGRLV